MRRVLFALLFAAACVVGAPLNHALNEKMADDALLDSNLAVAGNVQAMLPSGWMGPFSSAFVTSYLLIIVSEIGDKTFFIAALLAMKRGARVVFAGAASALAAMTILSALAGRALPALVNPYYTHLASVALFVFFGTKLLWEAYNASPLEEQESPSELIEVERQLSDMRVVDMEEGRGPSLELADEPSPEKNRKAVARTDVTDEKDFNSAEAHPSGISMFAKKITGPGLPKLYSAWFLLRKAAMASVVSAAFTEAFTMTFAAEWGDRSQIATLALGASKNIWGVNLGACLGHVTCTTIAIAGGRVLASRISEKTVNIAGGCAFLIFATAGYFLEM